MINKDKAMSQTLGPQIKPRIRKKKKGKKSSTVAQSQRIAPTYNPDIYFNHQINKKFNIKSKPAKKKSLIKSTSARLTFNKKMKGYVLKMYDLLTHIHIVLKQISKNGKNLTLYTIC